MIVFIIGLPRVGKSTFGMKLSEALRWNFIDLDFEIMRLSLLDSRVSRSIKEIYKDEGDASFRLREEAALANINISSDTVVSLGGGALLSKKNRELVERAGKCIYLKCDEALLAERHKVNPLSSTKEDALGTVRQLERTRAPYFEQCADLTVDLSQELFERAVLKTAEWVLKLRDCPQHQCVDTLQAED